MDTPAAASFSDSDESSSLLCAGCGYRLFGIDSACCPECGLTIDRTILGQSAIPWSHRKTIGAWRAFWRTVIRVNFRPGRIALDVNRPVSLDDARKFRRICIAMAWVPSMAWIVGLFFFEGPSTEIWEKAGIAIVMGLAVWLFLLALTGIPSYFFHPKTLSVVRQNRAVALSHYASAALAWVWIIALLPIPVVFINLDSGPAWQWRWIFLPIIVATYAALGALPFMLVSNAMSLLKHSTHCSSARRWAMRTILPLGCLLSAALFLVGIPAVALFIVIVVVSVSR